MPRPAKSITARTLWSAIPLEPTSAGTIAGLLDSDVGVLGKRLEHMAMTGRIERVAAASAGTTQRWAYYRRPGETFEQCEAVVKRRLNAEKAVRVQEQSERMKRAPVIAATTRTEWRRVDGQRVKVTVYVPPVVQQQRPERYFGALAVGSYAPSDSAVARAAEDRRAA